MKFYTLKSDEEEKIPITPEEKIIPAEDFSKLKKADEILKQVKQEAYEYKLKCAKEAEKYKEQSAKEGFEEGLSKFNTILIQLDKKLHSLEEEFHKKILPIALQAAKKILGEELKLHPDRIVAIVKQALKPVLQHYQIKIYVNKNDIDLLKEKQSEIESILQKVQSFSVEEREDIEPGGCLIETEAGIINAQLENQWRSLEEAFKKYMEKKKI